MELIYLLPGAFLAPVIHEWVKAITSTLLGDPTPRNRGFLTFNPLKYFEPLGFMLALFFGGFGWGQPVPTSSLHYKDRRKGILITYITPSVVNLIVGMLAIITLSLMANAPLVDFIVVRHLHIHLWTGDIHWVTMLVLYAFAQCNILLALFNLIPIPPLDAAKILQLYAHPDTLVKVNHFEKPMQMILILALVFGLAGLLFTPIWHFILRLLWLG